MSRPSRGAEVRLRRAPRACGRTGRGWVAGRACRRSRKRLLHGTHPIAARAGYGSVTPRRSGRRESFPDAGTELRRRSRRLQASCRGCCGRDGCRRRAAVATGARGNMRALRNPGPTPDTRRLGEPACVGLARRKKRPPDPAWSSAHVSTKRRPSVTATVDAGSGRRYLRRASGRLGGHSLRRRVSSVGKGFAEARMQRAGANPCKTPPPRRAGRRECLPDAGTSPSRPSRSRRLRRLWAPVPHDARPDCPC
jgi:hypothetical protein